jgi:hypothetical protein
VAGSGWEPGSGVEWGEGEQGTGGMKGGRSLWGVGGGWGCLGLRGGRGRNTATWHHSAAVALIPFGTSVREVAVMQPETIAAIAAPMSPAIAETIASEGL